MPRIIDDRVPIFVWARKLSPETVRQLQRLAAQPYVIDHVAAMPDAHVAEGVSVGTVFATENALVPAAIGGDIGCGMAALRFDVAAGSLDRRALSALIDELGRAIPTGEAAHRTPRPLPGELDAYASRAPPSTRALERAFERLAPRHLGTLGGGNHFLELERDPSGSLWVVVHTGSRGVGAAIGAHHRRAAEVSCAAKDLSAQIASLDVHTEAGAAYYADLQLAVAFARANREELLARAAEVIGTRVGADAAWSERIDIEHNFIAEERHGERTLFVHRKGATRARAGELGIVPGSMGTATYLVRGLGAAASFGSCSHGAGRVLTRKEARRSISAEALEQAMRRVVFDRRKLRDLVEEAPAAYRDIREVLEDQADLVTPELRLEPIAVLKG